ncbi:exo-alpha-sialidase [Ekhidna sp.]|uniref:exo-alpha-sialidase n=1 Tax=Ekhidna sp. TaxID=2608089 RepID=UPI003299847F
MKSLTLYIIVALLVISCQPANEKAEGTSNLKSLEAPSGSNTSLPYLTKGGDNFLYMSWVEKRDSGWIDLKYSVLKEGAWQVSEVIASGKDWFVNWADYPMMAVDNQGNMVAHYLAKSSAGTYSYDVNVVFKPEGRQWSDPIVPHDDHTPTEHGFATLLPNNDGSFLLTWLDGRNTGGGDHDTHDGHGGGGAMTIRTATLGMNGILSNEAELDSRVCDCCQTGGAMTSNGPVIVYRDRSEEEVRDMSFVRMMENEWTAPSSINTDGWKINGCPVNGPRIATFDNTAAVAWFTAADGIAQVKVAFLGDSDKSFQEPIIIDDTGSVGRVDVVMKDEDSAIVSWLDLDDETPYIKYIQVFKDGKMGDTKIVSATSASRGSGFPQMEMVNGVLFFAWTNMIENETKIDMKMVEL